MGCYTGLKQDYNYMCFRAFYTNIYNIRLGFIKIESKISREEARTKLAKKTSSSRRKGEAVRLGEASLRLGEANNGQNIGLRFA